MAVQPVIMPKLGAYTEDVVLLAWLVGEGEEVAAGQPVLELETEKTTAEVEAEASGWLRQLVPAGEAVPIGATVALVAATREEYDELTRADGGHVPAPASRPAAPLVSPRARKLLRELGLGLEAAREIAGSGPGGRVLDRDVAAWVAGRPRPEPSARAGELTVRRTVPLSGRRGTIASRMVASLRETAQLTSVLELDVKPLVDLRARMNGAGASPRIGVTAIVVKLVAAALLEHPRLNARVTGEAIEELAEINVAVAVETDRGIVAPVVAGADRLALEAINARIVELAARARDGRLTAADLEGGTFTVSNGGIHPVDITTAILDPPQCALLWVGRIRDRPVAVGEGAIAVRPTLQACLTFDHRAVDGAPAAAFLATLQRLVSALPELPS
ncbi:MAG TPA: dihydrolipoamide acetyltransferase family protein [Gaiellaceae bacterium]|jgi:pyruvate/2-oxoglutarate dehydrogenase complex dihydrolipoamide acyltransferase (E2) component|nr:dihydrolipoamide acetyltransferase family protein [Gaiellaceae bacterium]